MANTMTARIAFLEANARHDWEDTLVDIGVEALEYAKDQAPWDDRTGDARDGLDVDVDSTPATMTLTMYHTVEYGQWLETIQNGRFQIIMPTLELYGEEFKQRVERGI